MLTIEERLLRMGNLAGRHGKLATEILDKVGKEILKRDLGYLDDPNYMYHILMPDGKGK